MGDFNGDGTADLALAGNDSLGGSDIDVFFWSNTDDGRAKKVTSKAITALIRRAANWGEPLWWWCVFAA